MVFRGGYATASTGGDYDPRTRVLSQGRPWDSEGQGLVLQLLLPPQGALEPGQSHAYREAFLVVGPPWSGDSSLITPAVQKEPRAPLPGEALVIPLIPEMPFLHPPRLF